MKKELVSGVMFLCLLTSWWGGMQAAEMPDASGRHHAWVFFTDKNGVDFDPFEFFDPKAIERRHLNGLCLSDTTDFPVRQSYLDTLALYADTIYVVSRWFNAANVWLHPEQVDRVLSLPFVERIVCPDAPLHAALLETGPQEEEATLLHASGDLERLAAQTAHLQGHFFRENGIDGSGVRIAIFDAGFPGVDTHPAFQHLRDEERIISAWDFHRKSPDVYRFNQHGTNVLSMIAGISGATPMGLATGAEFLLARTEIWREPLLEERYWLAAAEWADQMGADIINSSLGYYRHRYFPEEMDGHTSFVSRAASMAARKGMLVVNAAGNEGNDPHWRIIITPADADSVLTVGAVGYPSMLRTDYSSLGPTADKRMKPNVVAMGDVLIAGKNNYRKASGTSFSSPLVAGFAACLWQMFPNWSNMEVFKAIEQSSSLYPYFDYAHGHGVPQAGYFFTHPAKMAVPTFDLVEDDHMLSVYIRQDPNHPGKTKNDHYLYYQLRDPQGFILNYFVIKVERQKVISFDIHTFEPGQQILIFYDGFVTSWSF